MADWRTRPVSTNIQDYRNGVPLIDQIIEGYKYSGAADLFGDSYAAQMARQSTTPIKLTGGPGPYRGDPLISIETVRGRQVKPGMTLEQAKAAPLTNPPPSFDQMYRDSGGSAFNFVSQQPKSSGKMAEWWQSPAYNPYSQSPSFIAPGGGRVTGYQDDPLFAQATPSPKVNRLRPVIPTMPVAPNQPSGSIASAKSQARLPGDPRPYNGLAYGYDAQPGMQGNSAAAAINATVPTLPRGMELHSRSRDSLAYAQAGKDAIANMMRAQAGGGIIDLTVSNPSERGAQGIADSQGAPVRVGSKVYYPAGKAPAATRQSAPQSQGQATSGGWFSSLFGGGGNSGGGGLLRNMLQNTVNGMAGRAGASMVPGASVAVQAAQPGPTYATTEFQQNAFQTTPGAQMPSSMNNSRWTTGY